MINCIQKIAALTMPRGQLAAKRSRDDLLFELDWNKKPPGAGQVQSVLDFDNGGDQDVSPTIWCRADSSGTLENVIGASFGLTGSGSDPTNTDKYNFGMGPLDHQVDFSASGKYFEQSVSNQADIGTEDFFLVWHGRLSDLSSIVGLLSALKASEKGWRLYLNGSTLTFSLVGASTIDATVSALNYDSQHVQIVVAVDRSGYVRLYINGIPVLDKDISALSGDDLTGTAKATIGQAYTALVGLTGFSDCRIYTGFDIGSHDQDSLVSKLWSEYSGQKANKAKGNPYPTSTAERTDAYPHFLHRRSSDGQDLVCPVSKSFPTIEKTSDGKIRFAPQKTAEVGPYSNYDPTNTTYWNNRGTFAAALTDGPDGLQGKFRLTVSTPAVGDAYTKGSAFSGSTTTSFGVFLRRQASETGTLKLKSPYVAGGGDWSIDLSQLTADKWTWVDRAHPAVTIIDEFSASNESNLQIAAASGTITVDLAYPTFTKDQKTVRAAYVGTARTLAQEVPAEYAANDGNLIQGRARVEMCWRSLKSSETGTPIYTICDGTSSEAFIFYYSGNPRLLTQKSGGNTGSAYSTINPRDGNDHTAKMHWRTNDLALKLDNETDVTDNLVDPSTAVSIMAVLYTVYASVYTESGQCEYFRIRK